MPAPPADEESHTGFHIAFVFFAIFGIGAFFLLMATFSSLIHGERENALLNFIFLYIVAMLACLVGWPTFRQWPNDDKTNPTPDAVGNFLGVIGLVMLGLPLLVMILNFAGDAVEKAPPLRAPRRASPKNNNTKKLLAAVRKVSNKLNRQTLDLGPINFGELSPEVKKVVQAARK